MKAIATHSPSCNVNRNLSIQKEIELKPDDAESKKDYFHPKATSDLRKYLCYSENVYCIE